MGFERALEKTPTRDQELKMIEEGEKNFLSHSVFRIFETDAQRKVRLRIQGKIWQRRKKFLQNFLVGVILAVPVTLLFTKMARRNLSGVPYFISPQYNDIALKTDKEVIKGRFARRNMIAPLVFGVFYSYAFTENSDVLDYYCEDLKIPKML